MSNTQSKYGRRFDEEFKREVAALASQPGATIERVARDLGVSAHSVARWRRRFRAGQNGAAASPATTPAASRPAPSVSAAELERENRALRREVAELRQQREILSLNRSTGFFGRWRSPSLQTLLRGLHPGGVGEHAHVLQRPSFARSKFAHGPGGGQRLVGIHRV